MNSRLPHDDSPASTAPDASDDDTWLVEDDVTTDDPKPNHLAPWSVLIVDDDEDVHHSSSFALLRLEAFGRPVELLHAHSATEARQLIEEHPDIAVALVDVVMESDGAGLELVRWMRSRQPSKTRIVLRTGQPGYAPPLEVVRDYDIDDYRTKSELDRTRLICCLITAIRAYRELCRSEESRKGLELIVESASDLWRRENLSLLSTGILTQVAAVVGVPASGLVCVGSLGSVADEERLVVVSAAGRYCDSHGKTLAAMGDERLSAARHRLDAMGMLHDDNLFAMRIPSRDHERELFVFLDVVAGVSEDNLALLRLFASNISALFQNVELLRRLDTLAFEDTEVGIANRNALRAALSLVFESREELEAMLFAMEVDELEDVAATFGVDSAHQVLRALAERIGHMPGILAVARFGEFGLHALCDRNAVSPAEIVEAANAPIAHEDTLLTLSAHFSVVNLNDGAMDADLVLQRATIVRLAARSERVGTIVRYDEGLSDAVQERTMLRTHLRDALHSGVGLEVYLQPKVHLDDGRITGAEALARWSLDGRPISPAKFIPIAESSGLAAAITRSTLRTLGAWFRAADPTRTVPVAVNLSMTELHQVGFAKGLIELAAAEGLSPDRLEFEVTETAQARSRDVVVRELIAIRNAGYRIALDDFGTGYSSLSYVQNLPIDTIKVDRAFITPLTVDNARGSIAATAIAMAHSLGYDVVAEGIETVDQHRAMQLLGCEVAQGYLFGRPIPLMEFDRRAAA